MPPGWETEDVLVHDWHRVVAGHRGTVATIGMLSNIAEVVRVGLPLRASRLVVMGGLFPPTDLPPERDHNLVTDPDAALVALTAGIPVVFVPVDVTVRTGLYPSHVERLRRGDPFCTLLADLLDAFVPRTGHALSGGRVAHLHDPLTIACTVDDSFVKVERLPVTVARVGDTVRTFIDPVDGVEADVVRDVEPEAFAEHWLDVVLQGSA
jgi:inosine-uridine nucleoside N-ribohydrolase